MSLAVALLLPLLSLQDEAASFSKDARVAVALYTPRADSKPDTDLFEMDKAGVDVALVDFDGNPDTLDPVIAAYQALAKQRKEGPRLAPYLKPGKDSDL